MPYQICKFSKVITVLAILALAGCEGQGVNTGQEAESAESNVAAESTESSPAESQTRTPAPKEAQTTASNSEWNEPQAQTEPTCTGCGTIAMIEPAMAKGEASGIGVVAGGVVGGIVGNQFGGGTGKKIATVAGAVGGAFAGNEVEKYVNSEKYYAVTVDMDNGGTQTVKIANGESLAVGQRVKVDGNDLYLQ